MRFYTPVYDVVENYLVQIVFEVEAIEHDTAAVCEAPDVLVQRRSGQVGQTDGLPTVDG